MLRGSKFIFLLAEKNVDMILWVVAAIVAGARALDLDPPTYPTHLVNKTLKVISIDANQTIK